MKFLGYVFATIVLAVAGTIVYGFTLSQLWAWFVVPLFNAPSLSILQASGLMLVSSAFKGVKMDAKEEPYADLLTKAAIAMTIYPPLALLNGWILYKLIGV